MPNYKTLVVANPKSANGTTGKNIDNIRNLLKETGEFELKFTEAENHATILVREALKDGFNRIIAIGGDGTYNETINGFYEDGKQLNPDAVFAMISGGTGADFIKTIGIPKDLNASVKKIVENKIRTIDLGKVTYQLADKSEKSRLFLNIADAGIGGAVVERVNKTTKLFGGFASFLMGTIATVMEYKNVRTQIVFDNDFRIDKITNNVIVGNGCYFGGGMKILPDALPDDGLFDVLIIGDIGKLDFFKNVPKIYSGTHISDPKIDHRRAKTVQINSDVPLKLDIDGEQEGFTPALFTILPQAIKVVV
jgi:diacylglycerol kinase (ATP)